MSHSQKKSPNKQTNKQKNYVRNKYNSCLPDRSPRAAAFRADTLKQCSPVLVLQGHCPACPNSDELDINRLGYHFRSSRVSPISKIQFPMYSLSGDRN